MLREGALNRDSRQRCGTGGRRDGIWSVVIDSDAKAVLSGGMF
jgi:hypothetical protein